MKKQRTLLIGRWQTVKAVKAVIFERRCKREDLSAYTIESDIKKNHPIPPRSHISKPSDSVAAVDFKLTVPAWSLLEDIISAQHVKFFGLACTVW